MKYVILNCVSMISFFVVGFLLASLRSHRIVWKRGEGLWREAEELPLSEKRLAIKDSSLHLLKASNRILTWGEPKEE